MFINSIMNTPKISFKARLFDKNGEQVKSFDTFSTGEHDEMSKKGNRNTDIFVKNVTSIERDGEYHNFIDFSISNPLFGEQTFTNARLNHTTNRPIDKTQTTDLRCLELLTGNVERLENKALRKSLLQQIKKSGKKANLNPVKILNQKLSELGPKGGFNKERIDNMTLVAQDLLNDLVREGAKHIDK